MLVWCVYSCGRPLPVCVAVLVSYVVGAMVAVMVVLLHVLDVSVLRECEAGVRDG